MAAELALLHSILHGPLWSATTSWPMTLNARLCDLRPRFLPKHQVPRGHRAIARNGRVLLASQQTLAELAGRCARVRLQTWHKTILPGDRPEPYGVLLWASALDLPVEADTYVAHLAAPSGEPYELALEVGGGLRLEFRLRDE